jgi:phosphoglycerate dehydrogenase-like enzyme
MDRGGKMVVNRKIKTVAILFKSCDKTPMVFKEHHLEMIRKTLPDDGQLTFAETEEELLDKKVNADVLITWGQYSPVRYCQFATNLKWVFAFSAGVEGLVTPEMRQFNFRLSNAKGIHGKPISDNVLGYILSHLRCFPVFAEQQKKKIWKKASSIIDETHEKTVGIIGAGDIGKEVARKCKAFDMRVLGVKRTPNPVPNVDEVYASGDMDKVLEQSDFVVILVPITPDTVHLFNEDRFNKMKKGSYLINVGRGPVVDEKALIKALESGRLAGAALDVAEIEPLPEDSPLWEMPNVFITPHTAADSPYYLDRALEIFCRNVERFEKGEKLINEIEPGAKY